MGNAPVLARRAGIAARRRRSSAVIHRPRVNPFRIHEYAHGKVARVPDPMEFVLSDEFLDRPNLYPRQATLIKIVTLQDEQFTDFDYDVIGEWEENFRQTGYEGISPGILDRIKINKAEGRKWFREVLAVVGRRGSKGYIGGLLNSYVLWNYMHLPGGPQEYYGIDRDKRLTGIVFGSRKEQARDNLWRDWFNVVVGAPCFGPYISRPQAERLTIYAPTDILRQERRDLAGIESEDDIASFEILPAASTITAARGPASFAINFDEMAHVISSTANADAEQVYDAAVPSLDQFGKDGFVYAPSSPWQKTGKFFENWEHAIAMNEDGTPVNPERMMVQLPSWGLYEDWREAGRIPVRPLEKVWVDMEVTTKRRRMVEGRRKTVEVTEVRKVERSVPGPTFKSLKQAVQEYDEQMRRLERANPETFAVERRSRWAHSLAAYLAEKSIEAMFSPFMDKELRVDPPAVLREVYVAHGDPATSNKRFGWVLGHRVWDPKQAVWHAVIDIIRCWEPGDYEDHILDYDDVMDDIEVDVKKFLPEDVSFDQFNVPATIGRLRKTVRNADLPKQITVREVNRTRPLNYRHAELFKSALNQGLVHAPMVNQDGTVNYAASEMKLELQFLEDKGGKVDHPSTGPVQTKDIADALIEVVVSLLGAQQANFLGQAFDEVGLSGSAPEGTDPYHRSESSRSVQERLGEATGGRGRGMATTAGRGLGRGMGRRGR